MALQATPASRWTCVERCGRRDKSVPVDEWSGAGQFAFHGWAHNGPQTIPGFRPGSRSVRARTHTGPASRGCSRSMASYSTLPIHPGFQQPCFPKGTDSPIHAENDRCTVIKPVGTCQGEDVTGPDFPWSQVRFEKNFLFNEPQQGSFGGIRRTRSADFVDGDGWFGYSGNRNRINSALTREVCPLRLLHHCRSCFV